MLRVLCTLGIAALIASCSTEESRDLYERWDEDLDGRLSRVEFTTGANRLGFFERWDRDRDGRLSHAEFDDGVGGWRGEIARRTVFDTWDDDDDRFLSRSEAVSGAFGSFDLNDNGYISEDEFDAGVVLLDLG
jgi:Ca2+-binding EF-hand superfamily protein